MRFVLDNSVTMRWLFGNGSTADRDYAAHVLDLLEDPDTAACAPSLWPLEVANVIARAEDRGLLAEARSSEFIRLLHEMAIQIDAGTTDHALEDTLSLARRFALSAHDASYLELALREGLPLATLDTGLRAGVQRTGAALA